MYEWNEAIQRMIDWIEIHIMDQPSLLDMSKQIGYSPYYCSTQFHALVGMTLKSYVAGRRLAHAALEIRDTKERILDIALKYGYSSQEALTRAFVNAYSCTPAAYRKNQRPILLSNKQNVFFPEHYMNKGGPTMNKTILTDPNIRIEHIPAHRFIGIWDIKAVDYMSFWETNNCDKTCGILESMSNLQHPVVTCHTAGWYYENGKKGYFYGLGVSKEFHGEIPEGFQIKDIPESYYMVFFHPPFDFLKDCSEVMNRVEALAWSYNPAQQGYQWNEEVCPIYQRQFPETFGYEILRPIKKR